MDPDAGSTTGHGEAPKRTHIFIDGVANVVVRIVPGLEGIRVLPHKDAKPVTVTPTHAGVRIGGRAVTNSLTSDSEHPVGIEVPWLSGQEGVSFIDNSAPAPMLVSNSDYDSEGNEA